MATDSIGSVSILGCQLDELDRRGLAGCGGLFAYWYECVPDDVTGHPVTARVRLSGPDGTVRAAATAIVA